MPQALPATPETPGVSTDAQPAGRSPRVALGLVFAIVAVSFAAIFFRKSFPTHPLAAAGWRLSLAALVLAPFVWRGILRKTFTRRMALAALAGGALYGLHFGSWVSSLALTSVAASVTLVTINPVFLGALSLITGRDRPGRRFWAGVGLAVIGLLLVGGADLSLSADALLGDGLAVVGALAMSLYLFLVRGLGKSLDWLAFSGVATAVGALSLFGAGALWGVPLLPVSGEAFLYIALAALLPQLVGHNLLTWALRHVQPTRVAMAVVAEPVGAALLAWLWLGEAFGVLTGLGCGLTLAAVLLAVSDRRGRAGDGG